jgi:hypothetical protein
MPNRNFRQAERPRTFICRSIAGAEAQGEQGEAFMIIVRLGLAAAFFGCAAAAHATTVVIFVEPMTLERYTKVFDTPGRDRVLLCMAPPATSGCTDVTSKMHR